MNLITSIYGRARTIAPARAAVSALEQAPVCMKASAFKRNASIENIWIGRVNRQGNGDIAAQSALVPACAAVRTLEYAVAASRIDSSRVGRVNRQRADIKASQAGIDDSSSLLLRPPTWCAC